MESLPSYVCSSSLLPSEIVDSLDTMQKEFFGVNRKIKMQSPLIAWDKCVSRKKGRFGNKENPTPKQSIHCLIRLEIKSSQNQTIFGYEILKLKIFKNNLSFHILQKLLTSLSEENPRAT